MNATKYDQRGSSLIEVLVSIAVSSIIGMALSQFSTVGYRLLSDSRTRAFAQQVAASTIEELSLGDPSLLTARTYSEQVSRGNMKLIRSVTITPNLDTSKSVEVSVRGNSLSDTSLTLATLSARLTSWSTP